MHIHKKEAGIQIIPASFFSNIATPKKPLWELTIANLEVKVHAQIGCCCTKVRRFSTVIV